MTSWLRYALVLKDCVLWGLPLGVVSASGISVSPELAGSAKSQVLPQT